MASTNQKTFFDFFQLLLPILTLIIGVLLAPYVEKYKTKYKLKRLKEYIWDILRLVNEHMKLQVEKIYNCLKEVKDFNSRDFTLVHISGKAIQNYHKLNHSDIHKIIVRRNKKKYEETLTRFKEINKAVDYFEEIMPNIIKHNEIMIKNINKQSDNWNNGVKGIYGLLNSYNTINKQNGIKPTDDTYIIELNKIQLYIQEKYGNLSNIEIAYKEFIRPTIDLTKNNIGDERAEKLMPFLEECKIAYLESRNIRNDFRKSLIITIRNILELNRNLELIINKYAP